MFVCLSVRKLYILIAVVTMLPLNLVFAQDDVGDFDISKVQEAISEIPTDAHGAQNDGQALPEQQDSIGTIILRIVGYLAIIVLFIVGLFWGMRKIGMVGSSRIGGGSMDVLEVLAIGQGRTVTLVRVMDSVLVLAQTPRKVTMLEKIEGQKAVELIASTKGGTSIVQFRDALNSFMGKSKKG